MPRLQADVIRAALAAEPTIEVVAEIGADELPAAAARGAQVAIVGGEGAQAPTALDLLAAEPQLKVFGVAESGRRAVLYECRPVATPLGGLPAPAGPGDPARGRGGAAEGGPVNFVDSVLVRLADPGARAALFDDPSLANLVEAAYDTEAMLVSPPFGAVFDDLRLGFAASAPAVLEGEWAGPGGVDRKELRLRLEGLGSQPPLRVDALWRGSLVVRTVLMRDHIEALEVDLPSLDVDPDIIADLGALPMDAQQLETERRSRVLERLRAGLDQPDAFGEDHLDRLLIGVGARGVSDLVEHFRRQVQPGSVQVRYTAPSGGQPTARLLPFTGAVLVRDQGFSVAELLMASRLLRAQAEQLGLEAPPDPTVRRRQRIVVVWVVPASVFDDDGWPGGDTGSAAEKRAARFQRAGHWLAGEGIGLTAVD